MRRATPPIEREAKHESKPNLKMRAKPNWETMDPTASDTPDKLHIDAHLIPEGMAALWVTDSTFGRPEAQHRAEFEKVGWTPVHGDDFDGQFDGRYAPKGADGEIKVGSSVLMMRPQELNDKAKLRERRAAMEQVAIKEQALRGGDLNTSLDSQHPSAIQSNRINKSVERLNIPED